MPGNAAASMHGMPGIWALAQLYRDRADAENNFDALKINGDGQFHYARHRTLAAHRAHGSPDLQLVDAIGSAGTTVQTLGSDLQPSAVAARRCHAKAAWWTDALDHHKHPHQTGQDPGSAGQFGRIPESIEINCKAIDDAQRLLQIFNRAFDKFKLPNTDRPTLLNV